MNISVGDRFVVNSDSPRGALGDVPPYSLGTVVRSVRTGTDGDGDARVRDTTGGGSYYVLPRFLTPEADWNAAHGAPEGVAPRVPWGGNAAPSLDEAWKGNNEVEFTVTAQLERFTTLTVGCKSAPLSSVMPLIRKMEKRNDSRNDYDVTLRVTLENGVARAGSQSMDIHDASSYARDIKIISTEGELPKPDVTVTLTWKEAVAIGVIQAKVGGSPAGPRGDAERGLTKINGAVGYSWETNPLYSRDRNLGAGIMMPDTF